MLTMKTRSKTRGSKVRESSGVPVDQMHQIKPKKKRHNERRAVLPVIEDIITINHLPLDCLSQIFSYLSVEDLVHLPAVCKYWRDLKSNAWRDVRRLDLISFEKSKNPSSIILKRIQMNSKEATRSRFTTGYPRLLALSGRFLKVLEIPVSNKFDILGVATDNCQNLRRICVRFDYSSDTTKQCRDLGRLFEKNKKTLRSVTIIDMGTDFNRYIECLLQLPEELVELQLWNDKDRYIHVAEHDVREFFRRFVPAILRLKNLQTLVLNGIGLPSYLSLEYIGSMDSCWFAEVAENHPVLEHIILQVRSLRPEFIIQLFAFSELETLRLTADTCPSIASFHFELIVMIGFHTLKKFIGTTIGDPGAIQLMEIASELEFLNLSKSQVSSQVLDKAHEVTSRRTNNISLRVIVDDSVIDSWKEPENTSPLLTVERSSDYNKRVRD